MVAVTDEVIALVVIVKVAVFAPALTVTLPGSMIADWVVERFTRNPPVGAFADKVTVAVTGLPAVTVASELASLVSLTVGSSTVRAADAEYPVGPVASIVAFSFAVTAVVATVNLAVLAPAATVTVAGTEA